MKKFTAEPGATCLRMVLHFKLLLVHLKYVNKINIQPKYLSCRPGYVVQAWVFALVVGFQCGFGKISESLWFCFLLLNVLLVKIFACFDPKFSRGKKED